MSPHQSKTGVYVFFCISLKVNSCFCGCFFFLFFVMSLVASLSFFLSFSRKPFSFPPLSVCSLFFFCVDHCVARAPANLCRRRSVAFCPHFHPHSRQGPAKNGEKCIHTHPESPHAVLGTSPKVNGERCISLAAVGAFFEWDARACLERGLRVWDVAPWWRVTGSVLIWGFSPR